MGIFGHERFCPFENRFLHVVQQFRHRVRQILLRNHLFSFSARTIPARKRNRPLLDVLRADFDAHGYAAQFPIVEFETGCYSFAIVQFHPEIPQLTLHGLDLLHHLAALRVVLEYRHDDDLIGRQARR